MAKFKYEGRFDPQAIPIPYPPIFDEIRQNRGFTSLRGRPEVANTIAEVEKCPALKRLLVKCAQDACPIVTVGCDIGEAYQPQYGPHQSREAGGYVQIMSYNLVGHENGPIMDGYVHQMAKYVSQRNEGKRWVMNVDYKMVQDRQKNSYFLHPSAMIWFFARSRTSVAAMESRELFVDAISEGLFHPDIMPALKVHLAA